MTYFFAAWGIAMASGGGWLIARRWRWGVAVFAVRAILLFVLVTTTISTSITEADTLDPTDDDTGSLFLERLTFAFFILSTIGSAATLAFVSRHRSRADSMQTFG